MVLDFEVLTDEEKHFFVWNKYDFGSAIRIGQTLDTENHSWDAYDKETPPEEFADLAQRRKEAYFYLKHPNEEDAGGVSRLETVRKRIADLLDIIQYKTPMDSLDDISDMITGIQLFCQYFSDLPITKNLITSFVEIILPLKLKSLDISLKIKQSQLGNDAFLYKTILDNLNILHDINDARVLSFTIRSIGLLLGKEQENLFKSYAAITHGIPEHELVDMDEGTDLIDYISNLSIPSEMSQKVAEILSSDLTNITPDTIFSDMKKDDVSPREINNQIVLGSNFDMGKISDLKQILYDANQISTDTVHDYFGNDMNPEYQLTPEMIAYLKVSNTPLLSIVGKDENSLRHIMTDKSGTSFLIFRDPSNISAIYGLSLLEDDGHKRKCLRTLIPKNKEVTLEMGDILDADDI